MSLSVKDIRDQKPIDIGASIIVAGITFSTSLIWRDVWTAWLDIFLTECTECPEEKEAKKKKFKFKLKVAIIGTALVTLLSVAFVKGLYFIYDYVATLLGATKTP